MRTRSQTRHRDPLFFNLSTDDRIKALTPLSEVELVMKVITDQNEFDFSVIETDDPSFDYVMVKWIWYTLCQPLFMKFETPEQWVKAMTALHNYDNASFPHENKKETMLIYQLSFLAWLRDTPTLTNEDKTKIEPVHAILSTYDEDGYYKFCRNGGHLPLEKQN